MPPPGNRVDAERDRFALNAYALDTRSQIFKDG